MKESLNTISQDPQNGVETKDLDTKDSLSRGQRKRLAKREQYLKREKMVMSSLRLKRLESQKGQLDGMDTMKEALSTVSQNKSVNKVEPINKTDEMDTAAPITKSNRSKRDIASKEVSHLGLVLQHPAFINNPFATIQEHLKNTLAGSAEELRALADTKRKQNEEKASNRKEARKERIREARYQNAKKAGRKARK